MDWRHPNAGCVFHKENVGSQDQRDYARYARSIKNPPLYGLCTRDYDRDHRPREWPSGTEYQYAYCSNYRSVQPELCNTDDGIGISGDIRNVMVRGGDTGGEQRCVNTDNLHKLYEVTPIAITDKYYRGAVYKVNDPIGVLVPEEMSRRRETLAGPIRISCRTDLENVYTSNSRYKEWISRPMIELHNEIDSNLFFCRLPETPTQYWDFYNTVRMRRPERESNAAPKFQPCLLTPLPLNKNIPNIPPLSSNPFLGKFNKFQTAQAFC